MEKISEEMNMQMHKKGISEWKEKCLVLSTVEQISVLHDLKDGKDSELLAMVRLPFPKFAELYFKQFENAAMYTKNPDFGYKLYMLSDVP